MDLLTQLDVGEVVADERRAHGPAQLLDRLVGGVLGVAAGEAAQDLLVLRGAQAERGGTSRSGCTAGGSGPS